MVNTFSLRVFPIDRMHSRQTSGGNDLYMQAIACNIVENTGNNLVKGAVLLDDYSAVRARFAARIFDAALLR